MRAPGALDLQAVDHLRAGPALGTAQHDHRPGGAGRLPRARRRPGAGPGIGPDLPDPVRGGVDRRRHQLVHDQRVVPGDVGRLVAVAAQQRVEVVVADPGQQRRVGDLEAVQVQDRQHGPVPGRVDELVRVPARRQRPGLCLAVADHAGHDQIRVVEGRAEGVRERVAELAALVDRARGLRRDVARHPAGERELAHQRGHPDAVPAARSGRSPSSCPPASSSPARRDRRGRGR